MTEAGFAILMLLVLGWAVFSSLLAGVNITGALVLPRRRLPVGQPVLGARHRGRGCPVGPPVGRGDPGAAAVRGRLPGQRGAAQAGRRRPGAAPRPRAPDVDHPRVTGGGLLFDDMSWAARRVRRRHPGPDGRGAQCPGDHRRADPDAAAPRAERGERAERRHRHPHRRVHARGRRDRPRSGGPRPRRGRGRPARARAGRRRRPGGRPRQRRGHRVRLETAMDRAGGRRLATLAAALPASRSRWPSTATASSPRSSPGIAFGAAAAEGAATWRSSESSRSSWASSWRWPCGSSSAPPCSQWPSTTSRCRPWRTRCSA